MYRDLDHLLVPQGGQSYGVHFVPLRHEQSFMKIHVVIDIRTKNVSHTSNHRYHFFHPDRHLTWIVLGPYWWHRHTYVAGTRVATGEAATGGHLPITRTSAITKLFSVCYYYSIYSFQVFKCS